MKKIGFLFAFFILTVSAFGQQFLWSTLRDKAEKFVPINNVTREVLEFYDQKVYPNQSTHMKKEH